MKQDLSSVSDEESYVNVDKSSQVADVFKYKTNLVDWI